MNLINALHVRIEGLTSSFRYPLIISGLQLSVPVPTYSSILGMISSCAGRIVSSKETRIGFEFYCKSDNVDIERTVRLSNKGKLKLNPVQGILKRQIYWHPVMDLYLTNLNLKGAFENPVSTPSFGRSQDIAWISRVNEVTLTPLNRGMLAPTLIPMNMLKKKGVPGLVSRLPEWFDNTKMGHVRKSGPFGVYLAMNPKSKKRFYVEGRNLFHPSDSQKEDVIYLHEWVAQ